MEPKYEIGQTCYLYIDGDYEQCVIKDRKKFFESWYYLTDIHWKWQREAFFRN